MKALTLAFFLSAGIAGAYAQTNNTGTTPNQNTSPTIKPGNNNTETPRNPNNNGTENDGVNKNKPQNTIPNNGSQNNNNTSDTIRDYQTDPRNEYESPNKPNPNGKTTTPDKTIAPDNTRTPDNKKSTTPATPNKNTPSGK